MINAETLCLGCMNDNGGAKICPICGFDTASHNPSGALPLKFIVNNRYFLGKALKINGEGITYIAWDRLESTSVVVKEYYPAGFARRNPDKTVSMISGCEYTFNEGLLEFLEINRAILHSELPSLIPVIEVFEENGTAYAVAKNIQGITLSEFLLQNGDVLKWEQARALFLPLIDTLNGMNELGFIHGAISPETIIVGRDGKLRISGYSISKTRMANTEFEFEIYDGFAAAEQYGFEEMAVDKYTDVYGFTATLFRVLIGTTPLVASQRIQNDAMSIPAKFAEELPRHVLSALANGLQVLSKDRTCDIEALKNELVYGEGGSAVIYSKANEEEKTVVAVKSSKKGGGKYLLISALCTAGVFLIIAAVLVFGVFKDDIFKKEVKEEESSKETVISQIEPEEESSSVPAEMLYEVPNFIGKYYSDLIETEAFELFDIVISGEQFSDNIPKGAVYSQSVSSTGEGLPRGGVIELVISSGPRDVTMPNLVGLTAEEARIELLKRGFLDENIEIDYESVYDLDSTPKVALKQEPSYGTVVNRYISVKVYINAAEEEESSDSFTDDGE